MTSTLALKKADYESEVGDFMGWGRGTLGGDIAWTAAKIIKIHMDVASGLRRFYYCGHPWTFLNLMATLTLKSGSTTVQMPEDFCGLEGGTKALVLNSTGSRIALLDFLGAGRVQQAFADSGSSGPPQMIAQRPVKMMAAGKLQRSELLIYPEADQDYTLKFPYFFTQDYLLDVTQPYAYGGVEHHETILECCVAVAEIRRDNAMGVHSMEAQRLLQMSIQIDRRKQPKKLGYNRDLSDGIEEDWNSRGQTTSGGVVINGISYG